VKAREAPLPESVRPVAPANVPLPARLRLPVVLRTFAVLKKLILPVLVSPSCRVCLAVVASVPLAER